MSTDESERIAQLLKQAQNEADLNDLTKAFEHVKEASHLAPENAKVKEAFATLQAKEQSGSFLELLDRYLQNGDGNDGRKALAVLDQKQLSSEQAVKGLTRLLNANSGPEHIDALTATLLIRSIDARKEAISVLLPNATTSFDQMFERGNESFRAFAALPLDETIWSSKTEQKTAQQDVFRLSVAKLIEADVTHAERPMRAIVRQLAIAPANVSDLIDPSTFGVVLESLDIRRENSLRSQALLATSKMLEVTKERGEQMFEEFITSHVGRQTNEDFILAFSAAAAVFPVIPIVTAKLFMTDGFVQQLVPNLERNSKAAASGKRKSRTLEQAALELLSAACVDQACRGAIDRYCSHWLRDLSIERQGTHKALASLVLAKINANAQDEITARLTELVLTGDEERDQAIEGLAYTSLQPKIKEEIASSRDILQRLVAALKDRPNAAFGCLTVFSNLTNYKVAQTEEQKKISQLKAYANSSKPAPDNPLDDDAHVTARARKILDADVVPALVTSCKQTSSLTNIALVTKVLLSLSKEQKHRSKMTQQGAVKLLLQIRDRIAKTDKATSEASLIERTAAHALARLLISVNPSHVFTASLPATSAVSAILPLLSAPEDTETRDLLPTFEALLALTNLASMEGGDDAVRELPIRQTWDRIEDLLFSSLPLVQRAAAELVCNLMVSPAGVAKFADGSNDARRRMRILLALADVEDDATRRAAGGALAMLTEWDGAAAAVLDSDRGVAALLDLCDDDGEEIRHRGFACVLNVVSAPGPVGEKGVRAMKEAGAAEGLKQALRRTRNQDVLGLGVEVLKKLQ